MRKCLSLLLLIILSLVVISACGAGGDGSSDTGGTIWGTVTCGASQIVAIKRDGTLWAWGYNKRGQLGDGTNIYRHRPVQIGTDSDWTTVACGAYHTVAIKRDGTLWAWGYNKCGQLGDGTNIYKNRPMKIGTDSDWTTVACGGYHTVALKRDGTLWAWGYNKYGQLGDGTNISKNRPMQIGTDSDWMTVACRAYHTAALKRDGTLWDWGGTDPEEQLCDGVNIDKNRPMQIGTDSDWTTVACGYKQIVAIKRDGTLWAWGGADSEEQLCNGANITKNEPVQIGFDTDWVTVICGYKQIVAIKRDGTLWAWGYNKSGQLGDETNISKNRPMQIGADSDWASVVCEDFYTVALKRDGTLWAWVWGVDFGEPSDGTYMDKNSPDSMEPSYMESFLIILMLIISFGGLIYCSINIFIKYILLCKNSNNIDLSSISSKKAGILVYLLFFCFIVFCYIYTWADMATVEFAHFSFILIPIFTLLMIFLNKYIFKYSITIRMSIVIFLWSLVFNIHYAIMASGCIH